LAGVKGKLEAPEQRVEKEEDPFGHLLEQLTLIKSKLNITGGVCGSLEVIMWSYITLV
jgi:hypothetical protein